MKGRSHIVRAWAVRGSLLLALLAASAILLAAPHQGKNKQKTGKQSPYALLAGTVFDENGRRVPDVEIRVREKEGKRHWETTSDAQGEFAVRLPAGQGVYIVGVNRRGLSAEPKEVTFSGDERQDISLTVSRGAAQGQKGSPL